MSNASKYIQNRFIVIINALVDEKHEFVEHMEFVKIFNDACVQGNQIEATIKAVVKAAMPKPDPKALRTLTMEDIRLWGVRRALKEEISRLKHLVDRARVYAK